MRRSPETTLDNSYFTLVAADFHNRMEDVGDVPYTVVGGLGLHAVTHAEKIDWDDHVVRIGNIYLPRRRESNGTVRDLDTLVHTTGTVAAYRDEMKDALGGLLVPSVFGLKPYGTPLMNTLKGLSHFTGDRYLKEGKGGEKELYWRLAGSETKIPLESLDPWRVEQDGQTVCTIPGPVAQLGAYYNRSITGVRKKDERKLTGLENVVMPNGKISDIPKEYREQYFAFLEQAEKVKQARQRLGLTALKARLLERLEEEEWAVKLAQGEHDGLFRPFTGKQ